MSLAIGLESVKVGHARSQQDAESGAEPARSPPQVEPENWGFVTTNAAMLIEQQRPERTRVYCHTLTDSRGRSKDGLAEDFAQGLPGAWSASLDRLAFGRPNGMPRLIVQSAGNVTLVRAGEYPALNETSPVEPPGQAWNALTVGAMTHRVISSAAPSPGHQPVVRQRGALGPRSRTSLTWGDGSVIKPELVLEGGNLLAASSGEISGGDDQLRLLTTHFQPHARPLTTTGDTSAAAALGARAAAQILAEYSTLWPETVRGLLVHTAEWTEAMLEDALGSEAQAILLGDRRAAMLTMLNQQDRRRGIPPKRRKENLLRTVGYGVPSLDRALEGARNSVTMLIQDELQPFVAPEVPGALAGFGGMHLHPISCWPLELLARMGEVPVTLRVTLSYFIDPNPMGRPATYSSHGLRFDLRRPTEAHEAFVRRVSGLAADGREPGGRSSQTPRHCWYLGPKLQRSGSLHTDWWEGSASQLANCGVLAVYPVSGWWRSRPGLKMWDSRARYSLVVSLSTPSQTVDLYNEVRLKLRPEIPLLR